MRSENNGILVVQFGGKTWQLVEYDGPDLLIKKGDEFFPVFTIKTDNAGEIVGEILIENVNLV